MRTTIIYAGNERLQIVNADDFSLYGIELDQYGIYTHIHTMHSSLRSAQYEAWMNGLAID